MNQYLAKLRAQPINLLAVIAILSVIVGRNVCFLLKQEVAERQYLLGGDLASLIRHRQFETLADFHLTQANRFQTNREELALITEIRNDRDAYEAVFAQAVAHYENGEVEEAIRLSFDEGQGFIQRA